MAKIYRYRGKCGDRVRLESTSYQVRDPRSMMPAGWIAQAQIWEDRGDTTIITPFWPYGSRQFASRREATKFALHGAAKWVDEGRPPVRRAGA